MNGIKNKTKNTFFKWLKIYILNVCMYFIFNFKLKKIFKIKINSIRDIRSETSTRYINFNSKEISPCKCYLFTLLSSDHFLRKNISIIIITSQISLCWNEHCFRVGSSINMDFHRTTVEKCKHFTAFISGYLRVVSNFKTHIKCLQKLSLYFFPAMCNVIHYFCKIIVIQ